MFTCNAPALRGSTFASFRRPRLQIDGVGRVLRPRFGVRWPVNSAIFRMSVPAGVAAVGRLHVLPLAPIAYQHCASFSAWCAFHSACVSLCGPFGGERPFRHATTITDSKIRDLGFYLSAELRRPEASRIRRCGPAQRTPVGSDRPQGGTGPVEYRLRAPQAALPGHATSVHIWGIYLATHAPPVSSAYHIPARTYGSQWKRHNHPCADTGLSPAHLGLCCVIQRTQRLFLKKWIKKMESLQQVVPTHQIRPPSGVHRKSPRSPCWEAAYYGL
jgi:hypothetical protein